MNIIKRAWYYVTRKRIKTLILFSILLCMSTALISGAAILRATKQTVGELEDTLLAGFTMKNNMLYNMGTNRGAGNIPDSYINQIVGQEGIASYIKRMLATADLMNAKVVEMSGASSYDQMDAEKFGNSVDVVGVNRSDLDPKFMNGALTLTQGRHLNENDVNKVLVHEAFAKQNGLKIGDKLKLQANPYDADNTKQSVEKAEPEIVGLFSGTNSKNIITKAEMSENVVLSDLHTVRTLYQYTEKDSIYMDASFYVKNATQLEKVMREVEKLPLDWNSFMITKLSQTMSGMMGSLQMIRGMVTGLLVGTFIVCVAVLVLVLMLWMGERKRETGVLLSLGIGKKQIIAQYLLELILIAVVSSCLSLTTGRMAAQTVADQMTTQATKEFEESVISQANGMLGADLETVGVLKTVSHLDVVVETSDLVFVFAGGLFIILTAVLASSIPMLKVNPKELLA